MLHCAMLAARRPAVNAKDRVPVWRDTPMSAVAESVAIGYLARD